MYVFVWFDCVGYTFDTPTDEDLANVESGDLLILEIKGTDLPPGIVGGSETIQPCLVDRTPDGAEYHYVPLT